NPRTPPNPSSSVFTFGASAVSAIGVVLAPPRWPPPPDFEFSQAETMNMPVFGLYEGGYQFVPPRTVGMMAVPSPPLPTGTLPGTRMGRPFASNPFIQFTLTNGLP